MNKYKYFVKKLLHHYLLHSVALESPVDTDRHLVQHMFHYSYIVDNTMLFYSIVPCTLQGTDIFFLHYTSHCSHIFYHILSLDLGK